MSKKHKQNLAYRAAKRTFDVLISCIGCIFLLPLTLIVKIIYLAHGDKHSIFLEHYRVGKNGKIFRIRKFRTMVPGAEAMLDKLKKDPKYRDEFKKYGKIQDDPRVNKYSRFLRKSSLDELPQLYNIIAGHMSLVGPRPLVEGELDEFGGDHKRYESMRPGLTGWWAVNGRSDIDYKKRLELEYYYVDHASLGLDMKIILKTFGAVCGGEGKGAK
ncbi:sugar transferase [Candidatus Saccharibacteria bacterium]|nr:sugar transferase [Candidatus Saccharibacteria bacterium]